jgi:cytochrome c oxidase subunit 2
MKKKIAGLTSALLALPLALQAGVASAAYQLNLTQGVTRNSISSYDLHNLMMWVILVIFVGVFGVMFYSVYAHRKSQGHKAATFHENTTVELIWTIIPLIILVFMAWPAT